MLRTDQLRQSSVLRNKRSRRCRVQEAAATCIANRPTACCAATATAHLPPPSNFAAYERALASEPPQLPTAARRAPSSPASGERVWWHAHSPLDHRRHPPRMPLLVDRRRTRTWPASRGGGFRCGARGARLRPRSSSTCCRPRPAAHRPTPRRRHGPARGTSSPRPRSSPRGPANGATATSPAAMSIWPISQPPKMSP